MEIWHLVVFFLAFRSLLANDIARRRRSREAMRERLYRRRMKLHEGRKRRRRRYLSSSKAQAIYTYEIRKMNTVYDAVF